MVNKIKGKTQSDKESEKIQKRQNKLNSLKNQFESGKIKNFGEIFAIFDPSPLAIELNITFYTFKKKVADPGEFTNNEIIRFAKLINVDEQIIVKFIFEQINELAKTPLKKRKISR